eukprot:7746418-Pyramimonas_sp.AAC.1
MSCLVLSPPRAEGGLLLWGGQVRWARTWRLQMGAWSRNPGRTPPQRPSNECHPSSRREV